MATLKKNILYSGILTTANYIFPLLTYPYVSRVLGVENIGACNFVDSVIHYFILLSTLGIGVVGIREIASNKTDGKKLQVAFSKLFTINTITTFIAVVVLLFAIYSVDELYNNLELMWIGVMKLIFNYLLIEWFYKGLEDFKYITNRTIVIRVIYVLLVFLCIKSKEDVELYYFLTCITIALNALLNLLYAKKYVVLKFHLGGLQKYCKSLSIIGIYGILTSMYTTFNVAYLGFVSSDIQVGYYTTSTKIHSIISMIFTAITGVLMPRMSAIWASKQYDQYKQLIRKSFFLLFLFAIPSTLLLELLAPQIIYLIAGPGYEGAIIPLRIIAPLILVIGIEQILIIQALMPMGKDKAVLINSIFGASIGILLNIITVPKFEAIGSAIVWLVSEITVMSSALYFFYKEWKKLKYKTIHYK